MMNSALEYLLLEVFGDTAATREWLRSSVPMLGGASPAALIENGRSAEVIAVLAGLMSGAHA